MKSYKYILMDWDGNLAQALNMWPDAIDKVLQQKATVLTRKELIQACGGVEAFLLSHTDLPEHECRSVLEEATELVKGMLPEVSLYPDAVAVLHALKLDNKKLAVITSSIRTVVEPLLYKFKLVDIFDAVVCIEDTRYRKPHAQPVEKALELLGGVKTEAVMIGDTEKDILTGHNAGIDSILFYPPEHEDFYDLQKLLEHAPTHVVSDFKDIIKIVH